MKFIIIFIFLSNSLIVFGNELGSIEKSISRLYSSKNTNQIPEFHKIINDLTIISDKVSSSVRKTINRKLPLSGHELDLAHRIVNSFIGLNYKMFDSTVSFEPKNIFKNNLNLNQNIKWLATHILIIQAFQKIIFPYFSNAKLRRILDSSDLLYFAKSHQLRKLAKKITSARHIVNIRKILIKFNNNNINIKDNYISQYLKSDDVQSLILNVKLYRSFRKLYSGRIISDFTANTFKASVNQLSGLFGNSVGLVKWRKGYLRNNTQIHHEILSLLKPLDIITEKTAFALTDTLIPGHFGHNAIYLGTKDQLENINMWNHPSIKPYQADIKKGFNIIEVLRSGAQLTTLKKFMNVDEFAIMRITNSIDDQNRTFNTYRIAMGQLNKKYDFNFDVETTDKIVCSELLYQAFDYIKWPTKKVTGRYTITPDHIVSNVIHTNSPLELIYYVSASRSDLIYKDKLNLASDLGFIFNENKEVFEKITTKCKYLDMPKDHPLNKCTRTVNELRYQANAIIERPISQINYSVFKRNITYPRWMTRSAF